VEILLYLVEHLSSLTKTSEAFLNHRHLFFGGRSKDMLQNFESALVFTLPKVRARDRNSWEKGLGCSHKIREVADRIDVAMEG